MFNFLHTFSPNAIIVNFGPLNIYWYGLFIVIAINVALLVSLWLGKKYYNLTSNNIFDLFFWLILGGILGARIYDVFLQLPYYIQNPIQIFQVWKGGLAIHGAIIAGLIIIYFFSKQKNISFFKVTSFAVPGLAIAQAIGRWGNYFNQELFGLPTNLPWGIKISLINRPLDYLNYNYFHPTFLYESLGCLIIFLLLMALNYLANKKKLFNERFFTLSVSFYMISYSLLRFFLEFIRLDATPEFFGLRWPQIISLIIILLTTSLVFKDIKPCFSTKKEAKKIN